MTVNHAVWQAAILGDVGCLVAPPGRILDLGCGNGETVREWIKLGYDAHGCDFAFKKGPNVDALVREGRLKLAEQSPYRLPYPDGFFDIVLTNQVMEHVQDYPSTLAEMRRMLKPDGIALHIFPSRWTPLESHVRVPLASILKNRTWLALWARVGMRKAGQHGIPWRELAKSNHEYLTKRTNYLTGRQLQKHFRAYFQTVEYAERAFLRNTPNKRGRRLYKAGLALPFLFPLFRTFWARVVLLRP